MVSLATSFQNIYLAQKNSRKEYLSKKVVFGQWPVQEITTLYNEQWNEICCELSMMGNEFMHSRAQADLAIA
jgi:hypothetical protein